MPLAHGLRQAFDHGRLVGRLNFGDHLVKVKFLRQGRGGGARIAGQHHDTQAVSFERFKCCRCRGLDAIAH